MHIHEEESAIEQGNRGQVGTACGEGFAPALFRFLFQDGKEDIGVRGHDGNKSKSLYKSDKNKKHQSINRWISARNCKKWQDFTEAVMYYVGPAES